MTKHGHQSVPETSGFTILIVDDDPGVLRALSRLLRSAGNTVRTFDRPTALLAADIPRSNACLIIDINLPEMDGVQLCAKLRGSGCGVPAILITGMIEPITTDLAGRAEVSDILYKPIDASVLMSAVSRARSKSRTDSV